jgi:cutinase
VTIMRGGTRRLIPVTSSLPTVGRMTPGPGLRPRVVRRSAWRAAIAVTMALLSGCSVGPTVVPADDGAPGACPGVEVVFARGTTQPPGFGRVGDPFVDGIVRAFPPGTVRGYAVRYPAASSQDYASGVADVREHVRAVRGACPATRFVLGGYSQGALVVAAAVGAPTRWASTAEQVAALEPAVAAVVVFGNPMGSRGLTLEAGPRLGARDLCSRDDAVCGRRGPWPGGHRDYPTNGAVAEAVAFSLSRLGR